MFLFRNLVVGTLCFCFEIFVPVVNVRIAAKLIFCSVNVWDICLWDNPHSWFGLENTVHHVFVCGAL
jgi:hypothetical protein